MSAIFERVSVREYSERPVEEEKIQRLLRAAMAAPSAGNQQPWEFYVVRAKKTLSSLAACSPFAGCVAKAPLAIVPCYRTEGLRLPQYAQIDLSAATENLLLEAVEQGLGAVWLGVAPEKERMETVKKLLNITGPLMPFAILSVGYPVKEKAQEDRYDESRCHYVEEE